MPLWAAQDGYSIAPLPRPLLASSSYASAINNHGQVVGSARNWRGEQRLCQWDGGLAAFYIGAEGSNADYAAAISDSGIVVGGTFSSQQAVVWYDGVPEFLERLGGSESAARDVNNVGTIVGEAMDPNERWFGVVWRSGRIEALETPGTTSSAYAINAAGIIAGSAVLPGSSLSSAVLWDEQGIHALPSARQGGPSAARALNDHGDAAGDSGPPEKRTAVLWSEGRFRKRRPLAEDVTSRAFSINNSQVIVGESSDAQGRSTPVLWTRRKPVALIDLLGVEHGWTRLTGVADINDRGQIAGDGSLEARSVPFLMTPYRCAKVRSLRTSCSPRGVVRARLKSGMPTNTVLHLSIDDSEEQTVFLDALGRATVRWSDQTGERMICVRECAETCAAVVCD